MCTKIVRRFVKYIDWKERFGRIKKEIDFAKKIRIKWI